MITVVGSLNMDLVINTDRIPRPGETVMGRSFEQIPGGKGGNQADAIAKLGERVIMIGCVGNDHMGSILKESLLKDGVETKNILEKEGVPTGVATIIVESTGNNAITVAPGANFALTSVELESCRTIIENSEILLLQLEVPIETIYDAMKIAKLANRKVILNPAPAVPLSKEMLAYVDILTPNESELEVLTGLKTDTMEQVELAAKVLIEQGVQEIIVTLGEKGCMHITKEMINHYPAYQVKAIDTTAAGDSFNGAIAVSLNQNKRIDEAIHFAMKVGAMTVTRTGAQTSLPTLEEVNKFDTWIQAQSE